MTLVTLLIHLQILKWKECSVRLNYPHLDVIIIIIIIIMETYKAPLTRAQRRRTVHA